MRIVPLGLVAALGLGVGAAKALAVKAPVVSLNAPLPLGVQPVLEQNGLKVVISRVDLHRSNPQILVALKNTSTESQGVVTEGSSWGYYSLRLEVKEVDGKVLDPPVDVQRRPRPWAANSKHFQTVKPGAVIYRAMRLHPPTIGIDPRLDRVNGFYIGFPGLSWGVEHRLVMRAVFVNPDGSGLPLNQRGRRAYIASPWREYRVKWSNN